MDVVIDDSERGERLTLQLQAEDPESVRDVAQAVADEHGAVLREGQPDDG